VVVWRFITERRAINLDPTADGLAARLIVYVANAFEVIDKLNALLVQHRRPIQEPAPANN
jgi:hypothetical protein